MPDQKESLLFCSFYRNLQCSHFKQELQYAQKITKYIIIGGDCNAHHHEWLDHNIFFFSKNETLSKLKLAPRPKRNTDSNENKQKMEKIIKEKHVNAVDIAISAYLIVKKNFFESILSRLRKR
ncbi:hypothetical protein RFI_38827, partial [Reticulomyxa filosa]